MATKRYTVESWDRFMSDVSYENARAALFDRGEFWLGVQATDGDVEIAIEKLA